MALICIANRIGTGTSFTQPIAPYVDPDGNTVSEEIVNDPYRPTGFDNETIYVQKIEAKGPDPKFLVLAPFLNAIPAGGGIYDIGDPTDFSTGPRGMNRTLSNPEANSAGDLLGTDRFFFRGQTWLFLMQWSLDNAPVFSATFGDALYEVWNNG